MKRFSSNGLPSPHSELVVERPWLVEKITRHLVGSQDSMGNYINVHAPHQAGKTTLMRMVMEHIEKEYPGQFHVGMAKVPKGEDFLEDLDGFLKEALQVDVPPFEHWTDVFHFVDDPGPRNKPVILILDEFDSIPPGSLNGTLGFFRTCYHHRNDNCLHGVAFIGIQSSLGNVDGGAVPFNVQRSVDVPNLSREEVFALYALYTAESGQEIDPEGVARIYDIFRGHAGFTSWFGALLTEKYNQVQPPPWERKEGPPPEGYPIITCAEVERVLRLAQDSELSRNSHVGALISTGLEHKSLLCELFRRGSTNFNVYHSDLQWLFLNGVLGVEEKSVRWGMPMCRFASPFVQRCFFSAFGRSLNDAYGKARLLTPQESRSLKEVLLGMDVPTLLSFYRSFLARRVAKGDAPWNRPPDKLSELGAPEAITHFNLFAWLNGLDKDALSVIPEFSLGTGTTDLLLMNRSTGQEELLQINGFTIWGDMDNAVPRAAECAQKFKRSRVYLVAMVDHGVYVYLKALPPQFSVDGIVVHIELIPWGFELKELPDPSVQ